MSHIEFSKAKHIKDLIIEHNLTHIIENSFYEYT